MPLLRRARAGFSCARAAAAAAMMAPVFVLFACQERSGEYFGTLERKGKDPSVLYVNSGAEPETLDPGKNSDLAASALLLQLFEGLTAYHPESLRPVQGVAERWDESPDHRLYRFYLRHGAKWSDGSEVTAHDFEYAWKRVLNPKTASRAAPNLYAIKNAEAFNQGKMKDESAVGVRALDAHTLYVELERPTPYFLDLTSFPAMFPVRRDIIEAFEAAGKSDMWFRPENIVSNGPYILEYWKFRDEMGMKQNPHYWDRSRMRLGRIVWLMVEDYRATMNLYKAGELDFIGDNAALPSDYMKVLQAKKDFMRYPLLSTYWYELNTRTGPLADARVRHALNLAVNKVELVERVARAGQLPALHYVPDFTGGGYAEALAAERAKGEGFRAADFEFNPARARTLLSEAGYAVEQEGGERRAAGFPPIEILYNTGEGHRQIAVAIQSMWKEHLGISVAARSEEWKVMLKNVREGRFTVARGGWSANYNHPQTFFDTFTSGSPHNSTGWADADMDALLLRAQAVPDNAESMRLYLEAERRAMAGMSKIPLFFYTKSVLIKPWVKGYFPLVRPMHSFKWLWLDENWRANTVNEPACSPLEFPAPGRYE